MLFVAIGDGESGKTSTINALMSEQDVSGRIHEDTRTVGIEIKRWTPRLPAGRELTFQVMDLAGQAVYSTSHQFFLVRRAIYALVWRAREGSSGAAGSAMQLLKRMVTHWMDSLQLRVPGATFLCVVTHIDCVASEGELRLQTEYVRRVVVAKQRDLEAASGSNSVLPLRVLNGGESFRVNCLHGHGVPELRASLIDITLRLPWYGEQIPASYLQLRSWVMERLQQGRTWIGTAPSRRLMARCSVWARLIGLWCVGAADWQSFSQAGAECGLDDMNMHIATVFLHETGALKYFGDVPAVLTRCAFLLLLRHATKPQG
eukprot:575673-Rhodomonas_salina.1